MSLDDPQPREHPAVPAPKGIEGRIEHGPTSEVYASTLSATCTVKRPLSGYWKAEAKIGEMLGDTAMASSFIGLVDCWLLPVIGHNSFLAFEYVLLAETACHP